MSPTDTGPAMPARKTGSRYRRDPQGASVPATVTTAGTAPANPASSTPLESDEEFLDGLSPCTRVIDSDPQQAGLARHRDRRR